jgi:ribonuclease P protein component
MDRLRRRADFRAASSGSRTSAGGFVLQARLRGDDGGVRVGFTVSRKVGNAVVRNRVRRRLREIVKLAGDVAAGEGTEASKSMRKGHDYVLIGRRPALTLTFADMQRQFGTALHRVHTAEHATGRAAELVAEYGRDPAGGRSDLNLHETRPSRPKPRDP